MVAFDPIPWDPSLRHSTASWNTTCALALGDCLNIPPHFHVSSRASAAATAPSLEEQLNAPETFHFRGAALENALAQAFIIELPTKPLISMQPPPHHWPVGLAPSDARADIECAFSNGQGSMVWDCTGFQALSKGRCSTSNVNVVTSLQARWKTKHVLYPRIYDTFAAFIMTLTGAICENSRKALLSFCHRACSRAIAHDIIPHTEICSIKSRILRRVAFAMVKTVASVASRGSRPLEWVRHGGRTYLSSPRYQ